MSYIRSGPRNPAISQSLSSNNLAGINRGLVNISEWLLHSLDILAHSIRNILSTLGQNWLLYILNSLRLLYILNSLRLLYILNSLNWLLNILDSLNLLFYNRRMNYLSFNSLIFNSFSYSLCWNIFNIFILVDLGNIFCLVFDSIVVCNLFFFWNIFHSLNSFIFNDWFLIRNVFNARFSLDGFS